MIEVEKAIELVDKFMCEIVYEKEPFLLHAEAKQCALICVDDIIEALQHHEWQNKDYIQFYRDVKREINKL